MSTARTTQYRVEKKTLVKVLAIGLAGWFPPMLAVVLVSLGYATTTAAVIIGLLGLVCVLSGGVVKSVRRIGPRIWTNVEAAKQSDSTRRRWADVTDPRDQYANRWAMYDDLCGWLGEQDWTGKVAAEFGGTNEMLRSFMPGASWKQYTYPKYDLQDLHAVDDDAFDAVLLDQTMEHIPGASRAFAEAHRILKPHGIAVITTPFLVPVHTTDGYGDYYRWTPQGMECALREAGFDPDVRMWGNAEAACALLRDMYMKADAAMKMGLSLSAIDNDESFPITVWALAKAAKQPVLSASP